MNELLGILIPLLTKGAGIMDIFRALGGSGNSSAGLDGLSAMMSAQYAGAVRAYPLRPNQESIASSFHPLLERLGIDTNTGGGQGVAAILGGLYHIFPDFLGAIAGIPNGSNFFSTIANGSAGIGMASGIGRPDMFNPYSILQSHRRTSTLAKTVYDMGIRKGGGYNIGFGHGLNMDELGKVSQRILSTDFIYRDENGNRIDPESKDKGEADRFKDRLEKFGSKINDAVSMLNKVTGSLDETLSVMDRLGGGNFLGGTEENALSVARKAKNMAAAIRMTSSMAGVSPAETWQRIKGLDYGIAGAMGLDPTSATMSGFSRGIGGFSGMSAIGTIGASMWAAMNPNALQAEKDKAFFVANGRTAAYARSNAAALSAAIADNSDMFTPEEIDRIKEMYRQGNANGAANFVRDRIGHSMYSSYLNDPAMRAAAVMRIGENEKSKGIYDDINESALQGNAIEADRKGSYRVIKKRVSDIGRDLSGRGMQNLGEFTREGKESARKALMDLAVKEGGFSESEVSGMKLPRLRRLLMENMDANKVAEAENMALIGNAIGKIDENTMSSEDENAAKASFIEELEKSGRADLAERLRSGKVGLGSAIDEYSMGRSRRERREIRKRITGGRYSSDEAKRRKSGLERESESIRGYFTSEERMAAIENDVKRKWASRAGQVKGFINSDEFGKVEDRHKFGTLEERINALVSNGEISLEKGMNFERISKGAISDVLNDMFGDSVGGIDEEGLEHMRRTISERMYDSIRSGDSMSKAYNDVVNQYIIEKGFTGDVKKTLEKFGSDDRLKDDNLYANISGQIDRFNSMKGEKALEAMRKLSKGKFGKMADSEIVRSFTESANELGISIDDSSVLKAGLESVFSSSGELKEKLGKEGMKDIVGRAQELYGRNGMNLEDAVRNALGDTEGIDDSLKGSIVKDDIRKLFVGGAFGAVQKEGIRKKSGFNAAVAGGSAGMAALNFAAIDMMGKGMDFKDVRRFLEAMGASEGYLSKLDDITANGRMNPFSNAIRIGGESISNEAIKATEDQIDQLSNALKESGITKGELSEAYGDIYTSGLNNEGIEQRIKVRDERRKDIERRLKEKGFSNSEFAGSLYKGLRKTFGDEEGVDILYDAKKRSKAKEDREKMAQATRDSAREDSPEYKTMKMIGDFLEKISPFIRNPKSIFNGGYSIPVEVTNS